MKNIKLRLYLLLALVCLFPNRIIAQGEDEEVMSGSQGEEEGLMLEEAPVEAAPVYYREWEAGFIYYSADSFKFGEYTGLEEEAFRPNGNFLIRSITPYDKPDGSMKYYKATGTNLGLDSRSLFGEYGEGGKYSVFLKYDQLPHFQIGDAKSLFVGAGTTFQTPPAGWVEGALTSDLTTNNPGVFPSSNQVDIETERTTLGGGFSWIPAEHWQIGGNYRHQIKDGTEHLAAYFGTSSGSARSSTLIIPVNYDFDDFDMGISFANEKYQFDLRYYLSLSSNDDRSVIWQSPYSTPALAEFDDGPVGQISLPPDNRMHQIALMGGYNFGETSRVSAKVSYAKLLQDDTFLPYTNNPGLAVPLALPRPDLDGEVDKIHAALNFSTRPWKNLDLGARYTYDDWDNNTPRDLFFMVMNDSADQDTDPAEIDNRINRNYSFRQQKAEVDAGYRLTSQTKLSLGYDYDWQERDYSEVAITREHTGTARLSSSLSSMASGWIEYAHSERNGSNYVVNRPLLSTVTPEFIADVGTCATFPFTGCRDSDPWQRKYYLADRQQDQVTASLMIIPADLISLGLTGRYTNEDYDESIAGLTDLERYSATLDISYTPRENINTYAYYTHEFIDREHGGPTINPVTSPTPGWSMDNEDTAFTFGAGIKWSKIKDKYDLTADYVFSKAITDINPADLVPPDTSVPFPDLVTNIHSLSLRGDYHYRDNVIMSLIYMFEHFSSKDWALDGVGQNTIGQVITLGNQSPDYNAHVFGLSLIYDF